MISNMLWKCTECHTEFNNHESYCESWRDKNKSFGCPGCKTMFKIEDARPDLHNWAVTIFTSVIIIPCATLFPAMLKNPDPTAIFLVSTLFTGSAALFILIKKQMPKPAFILKKIQDT